MSELISSVELKKTDDTPINFNFQFENGLPIKPIIETGHTFGFIIMMDYQFFLFT